MHLDDLRKSPLVMAATEARRPTRWWLAYLFSLFVALLGVMVTMELIREALFQFSVTSIPGQIFEGITNAITITVLALWVRLKERRPVSSLGFRGRNWAYRFLAGVAIGAIMLSTVTLILLLLGQYQAAPTAVGSLSGWAALLPFLALAPVWAVQSSAEETICRGYQVQVGALQLSGWLAVLLPAIVFSALHLVSGGFSQPLAGLNIVLFALLATLVALRQGSLWLVCGIHTGWNWFQGNAFGFPVSDLPRDTSVFRLAPTETAISWLSGGAFGPENSLIATAIWGLALIMAYRYFTTKPKHSTTRTTVGQP
ncbi:type II CAAX endopeptidase family protein [Thermoleptolyngbya sichuanensis XZ-Cy5]|nr:type II CAAX endopeptidase family protein [Thermoleptolyngbya sichuanensis XZ-Cy5]